jgi:hypothetical protein
MENKVLKLGGGGDLPKIYLLPSIGVTLGLDSPIPEN